jgi:hypothetical protein
MFQRSLLPPSSGRPDDGGPETSETLVSTYESTQRHNSEEQHRHLHCPENLKCHVHEDVYISDRIIQYNANRDSYNQKLLYHSHQIGIEQWRLVFQNSFIHAGCLVEHVTSVDISWHSCSVVVVPERIPWSTQPRRTSSADVCKERVILFTNPLSPLALCSLYVTLRFLEISTHLQRR